MSSGETERGPALRREGRPIARTLAPAAGMRSNRDSMATLFEQLGGFAAVSKIVSDFYDRVLDRDILAPYFDDVDMRRLMDHQTKFIASVLGGPASYSNDALRQIHAHLNIDRPAFDAMKEELAASLAAHGVPPRDVIGVIEDIEARAGYVITRR
jgi:hemoglobin